MEVFSLGVQPPPTQFPCSTMDFNERHRLMNLPLTLHIRPFTSQIIDIHILRQSPPHSLRGLARWNGCDRPFPRTSSRLLLLQFFSVSYPLLRVAIIKEYSALFWTAELIAVIGRLAALDSVMGSGAVRTALVVAGRVANDVLSFVVFTLLDVVDVLLCFFYKLADYALEAQWKPCYCSSSPGGIISGSSKIFVVSMISSTKLHLEDISDTLYSRPSFLSETSKTVLDELRRRKLIRWRRSTSPSSVTAATTVTVNSTIIQMLQGKMGSKKSHPVRSWSDCPCDSCSPSGSRDTLFVHAECPKDGSMAEEDVLFIHGFISSSAFWTETVFPNFGDEARARYRLLAVDLLGFGKSPKPVDSLYTLREHVETIEKSVLECYNVKSFHLVAHSLGSLLALALAVKHPGAVKSLTILAPPYFPVPKGEQGTQYVLRRVAPRRVWPPITFGSSVICWYEHISRTVCLILCKHHRLWERIFKFATRNRVRTYLMDGFFCHAHHASWHTLHNIICGSAGKMEGYLDEVRDRLSCDVAVFHGRDDELLPLECSYAVKSKIPRARVTVVDDKDHITIVVGRQKAFARELEEIWRNAKSN
ncbi:probable lysophospholipase BODYGUARD 1 [Musa acuminata AAA Group]|uniref:probable lysophospholipase BODYGUARD 1 n=1 Tax=Musa acuminata AAA Group TaxID=214697 RepID=UPI0031D6E621